MKTFYNRQFTGFNPVGQAAVMIAENAVDATALLNLELKDLGLAPTAKVKYTIELPLHSSKAIVLCDGDY